MIEKYFVSRYFQTRKRAKPHKLSILIIVKRPRINLTIYKNLSATPAEGIEVGSVVKAGDALGTVGESAMVEIGEEPHLHVEMTVNGLPVDPLAYLDEDAVATLKEDTNYEDAS